MSEPEVHVTLKDPPPPHWYVKAPSRDVGEASRRVVHLGDRCARRGCGLPPEHPIHLRPAGDDPREYASAANE